MEPPAAVPPADPTPADPLAPDPPVAALGGLGRWLVVLLVLGGGGLLFGEVEMAALVALSGLFAVAHAADCDRRWRVLYLTLAWVVPVGGAMMFLALGSVAYMGALPPQSRMLALGASAAGVAVALLTALPWPASGLSRVLFRGVPSSHTTRLASRIVVQGFCLAVAGAFAADEILEPLLDTTQPLFQRFSAVGQTVGSVVLGLAGVGFMIRRGWRDTLERLGLWRVTPAHIAVVAIGVVALVGLNAGADVVQQAFLPDLWARDQRVNAALAAGISIPRALLIGIMAGIGEEVLLRGALQPRLGLVLTSLLFASLHIQYSWYGMSVIFAFGLVLGIIRLRTSTSVAVAVHALYDVIVLMMVA